MKVFLHFVVLSLLGNSVAHAQDKEKEVSIGVLGLFHSKQVVISSVPGDALECKTATESLPMRDSMLLELAGSKIEASDTGNIAIITCDSGTGGPTEFVVSVPKKISRHYFGKIKITPEAHELRVVVVMAIETAVASIVAAESQPHAPMEFLKAQAIAARSFLLAGKGRHHGFDFCDTTHCQFLREPPEPKAVALLAAEETRGLVLSYKSEVFAAMYSRSCGGRTHTLDELGIPVRGYPYFAVTCNYCQRHPEKWVAKINAADAADLAATESARLAVARRLGWKTVPGNTYSSHVENGSVVLEGVGVGHGIGLCQRGGADIARQGASFREILEHYYPNTEVKQY
jgi:stage II sporulation protein D